MPKGSERHSKAKSGSDATQDTCAFLPADLVLRAGLMLPLPAFLTPSFRPYVFNFSKYCSFLLGVGKNWMFQAAGTPLALPVCHKVAIGEITLQPHEHMQFKISAAISAATTQHR